jgi:hypothetical protein
VPSQGGEVDGHDVRAPALLVLGFAGIAVGGLVVLGWLIRPGRGMLSGDEPAQPGSSGLTESSGWRFGDGK